MSAVPTRRLARAVAVAGDVFPNAREIRALWSPAGEIDTCVEVIAHDGRGRVYGVDVRTRYTRILAANVAISIEDAQALLPHAC